MHTRRPGRTLAPSPARTRWIGVPSHRQEKPGRGAQLGLIRHAVPADELPAFGREHAHRRLADAEHLVQAFQRRLGRGEHRVQGRHGAGPMASSAAFFSARLPLPLRAFLRAASHAARSFSIVVDRRVVLRAQTCLALADRP